MPVARVPGRCRRLPAILARGALGVVLLALLPACRQDATATPDENPLVGLDEIIPRGPEKPGPKIVQQPNAVADDAEANAFIKRFVNIGLAGNYTQYRLMTSYQTDPASFDDFKRAWNAVERIEITKVRKVLPATQSDTPDRPLGYEVTLDVKLWDDLPVEPARKRRQLRLLIAREGPLNVYRARPMPGTSLVAEDDRPAR